MAIMTLKVRMPEPRDISKDDSSVVRRSVSVDSIRGEFIAVQS